MIMFGANTAFGYPVSRMSAWKMSANIVRGSKQSIDFASVEVSDSKKLIT